MKGSYFCTYSDTEIAIYELNVSDKYFVTRLFTLNKQSIEKVEFSVKNPL